MTEEQLRKELEEKEKIAMQTICDTLKSHDRMVMNYLADFVASLCNISKEKMFSKKNSLDVSQARGLFWYSYRYMTGETYEKIKRITKEASGSEFTTMGVASSVNKMANLIDKEPVWKTRWSIIKRIIKLNNRFLNEPPVEITITLPKNVIANIKQE